MSNIQAKIIAMAWLLRNIGFFEIIKIFFEIFIKSPTEHCVQFIFHGKNVSMYIMGIRTDLAMLTEIFCFEAYEIKANIDPKLIIDGGANKGSVAIYFGLKYPQAKIHCYEPNIKLIPVLRKNIKSNEVNAEIFNEALSASAGESFFELNENHQYSKLSRDKTNFVVKTISLQEKYAGQEIDILKLDIEGEEEILLLSLDFNKISINTIIQEVHYDRVNAEKIFSLLRENNYQFAVPYSQYYYLNSKVERPILLAIKN